MTGLWDAERDASEAAQALAGLAALLREGDGADPRVLRSLAENGGAAAERVVAYLRRQCAPGDGEMIAAPAAALRRPGGVTPVQVVVRKVSDGDSPKRFR